MSPLPSPSALEAELDRQLALIRRGTAEIIREDELRERLAESLRTGRPLRVKLGVDPTAPDLHLGHTVVLRKLRHFQALGHTAIFLIGDFTALVGDPTGQSETRPQLSPEQITANTRTYLEQVGRLLDLSRAEVRYNSQWLDRLTPREIVGLCARYRLARMLERDDFRARLSAGRPIALHELLYPLLQAYDSVALEADVELGATEQKFNLLVGREIQREYGQRSQIAITLPILVGLDGQRKMSKSLGNAIGIAEPPNQMYGKLMSIPDALMWSYWELLTDRSTEEIAAMRTDVDAGRLHPMAVKAALAETVTASFHGPEAARQAAEEFRRIFSQHELPEQMPEACLPRGGRRRLTALLVELGLAPSRSEAERLVRQGAVELDGVRVDDVRYELDLSAPRAWVLRAGKKRFMRVRVD
jgi:tyrosyl-tRNA synthetase